MKKVNNFSLTSVLSFPQRSQYGSNTWRGNMDGREFEEMIRYTEAKRVGEVFGGSGTGYDVCQAMGIKDSIHLDLNPDFGTLYQGVDKEYQGKVGGWNALRDDIPFSGMDLVFSHPPYHNMVRYSGEMWGESHPEDLSRCGSYEEFIFKLNVVNAKIYGSLKRGGRHAMLVGDMKEKGRFYSLIKDLAYYGTLESHLVKVQHNASSYRKKYNGKFIPIQHEHLLLFKKEELWAIPITFVSRDVKNFKDSKLATWRDLVRTTLDSLGGTAPLNQIYAELEGTHKAKQNQYWKEKIRQTLQIYKEFSPVSRGIWSVQYHQDRQTA
ncbi:DNA methylase N-4/N-6 [Priestia filamentosa]|uniref:DNA methylase N-4/N-6 n=1 Tax=Priestia filamentosa TaxID=1402861 RepID=UPI00398225BA